ncbi:hypothetical protein HYQ46_001227 [Verticillium longisporum]|nr:hypothetical protein HYQ46_001227 [Verticillium longisporum]
MSRDTIASIQRLKNIQLVSLKPETECMIMQTIIQRQLRNAHVNRSEVARCGASPLPTQRPHLLYLHLYGAPSSGPVVFLQIILTITPPYPSTLTLVSPHPPSTGNTDTSSVPVPKA